MDCCGRKLQDAERDMLALCSELKQLQSKDDEVITGLMHRIKHIKLNLH